MLLFPKRIKYQFKMSRATFCAYFRSVDLTVPTRVIGCVGIVLSVMLVGVLFHDKYLDNNYEYSKSTALALGLDWQIFDYKVDPNHLKNFSGKQITMICLFYAFVYSVINALLILATVLKNRWYVTPWFVYESFSCISKMVALIHYIIFTLEISRIFISGLLLYIFLTICCLMTVFAAQLRWKRNKKVLNLNFTPADLNTLMNGRYIVSTPRRDSQYRHFFADRSFLDSPVPYTNNCYSMI